MNNRGSEWNRWDLHLHTKGTNKNDQFGNIDFPEFCAILFTKALEKDIKVVGITDYFSIENYLKVKKYQEELEENDDFSAENVRLIKEIALLPNVELRIAPVTGKGRLVNFHCIFNPEIIKELNEDFFCELTCESNRMTKDGIIRFGHSREKKLDDKKAYKKGINEFWIEPKQLDDLFLSNPNLRLNTFTVIANSSNDGASGLQEYYRDFSNETESSTDGIRDNLYKLSDAIFSSSTNDRLFFLGKKTNHSTEKIIEKFGSLKPCIHGSDAHKMEELFNPAEKRNCWIKAIPSFEGLLQIKYEPEQRVEISEENPNKKERRTLIKTATFTSANSKFSPDPIRFNPYLNVIIGGKSSGKSILLYHLAKTLQTNGEVDYLLKDRDVKYNFGKDPLFNFEVESFSGITQKLIGDPQEASIIPNIKYIPQNHLAELAEPNHYKKGGALLQVVRDLLLEHEDYNKLYLEFLEKIRINDNIRQTKLNDLIQLREKIVAQKVELKSHGSAEIYKSSIEVNSKKILILKYKSDVTEEEQLKYDKIQDEFNISDANLKDIERDFERINSFIIQTVATIEEVSIKKNTLLNSLETNKIKTIFQTKTNGIDALLNNLKSFKDSGSTNADGKFNHENDLTRLFSQLYKEKQELLEKLKPFYNKNNEQREIKGLELKVSQDRTKLKSILELNAKITSQNNLFDDKIKEILSDYSENKNEYQKIIGKLSERSTSLTDENLEIIGACKFQHSLFSRELSNITDRRSWTKDLERQFPILSVKKNNLIKFGASELRDIEKIFRTILNGKFIINKSVSIEIALGVLLRDYFVDFWTVKSDNDEMGSMSTGKASFVLLKLIVGLSRSESPILIDQPEDNLDNRSIATDLVNYLRSKKIERQIIVVTHNPNIVVNADAENVIVANQRGQNGKNESSVYQFDYVNGAIENNFPKNDDPNILLSMGIREHIADIVEGGEEAFKKREKKYQFK